MIKLKSLINEAKEISEEVKPVLALSKKLPLLYYYGSLDFQDKFIIYLDDASHERSMIQYKYVYDTNSWSINRFRTTPTGKYGYIGMGKSNPDTNYVIKHIKKWIKKGVKV